jgi:hypothetical protein
MRASTRPDWAERWANFGGNERKWAAQGVGPKSRMGCRIEFQILI